jgi:hypothetical protein
LDRALGNRPLGDRVDDRSLDLEAQSAQLCLASALDSVEMIHRFFSSRLTSRFECWYGLSVWLRHAAVAGRSAEIQSLSIPSGIRSAVSATHRPEFSRSRCVGKISPPCPDGPRGSPTRTAGGAMLANHRALHACRVQFGDALQFGSSHRAGEYG